MKPLNQCLILPSVHGLKTTPVMGLDIFHELIERGEKERTYPPLEFYIPVATYERRLLEESKHVPEVLENIDLEPCASLLCDNLVHN